MQYDVLCLFKEAKSEPKNIDPKYMCPIYDRTKRFMFKIIPRFHKTVTVRPLENVEFTEI